MPAIRVLIADDDPCVRRCIGTLLGMEADISVVGEADDGVKAALMAMQLRPDVVLMDLEMPRMAGLEATRSIKRTRPDTRVLVLGVYDSARAEAERAGADCFLLKDCGRARLADAIRRSCMQVSLQYRSSAAEQRGAAADVRGACESSGAR